ncbi:hypothetical protein ACU4FL_002553 [Listeria monocytogenes]
MKKMKTEHKTLTFEKQGVNFEFTVKNLNEFIIRANGCVSHFRVDNSNADIKAGKIPFETSINANGTEYQGIMVSEEFGFALESALQNFKNEIHAQIDLAFATIDAEKCVIRNYDNIYIIDTKEHSNLSRLDSKYYRNKISGFLAGYSLKYKPTDWDGDRPPFSYYTLVKKTATKKNRKESEAAKKMHADAETMSDEEFEDIYDLPRDLV